MTRRATDPCKVQDLNRALLMFERSLAGESQRDIAEEMGISATRVGHLLSLMACMLLNPRDTNEIVVPDHDHTDAKARRNHPEFWNGQIEKLRRLGPSPTEGIPAVMKKYIR